MGRKEGGWEGGREGRREGGREGKRVGGWVFCYMQLTERS